eukprot:1391193-Pyramimonas_sp.AAC.1
MAQNADAERDQWKHTETKPANMPKAAGFALKLMRRNRGSKSNGAAEIVEAMFAAAPPEVPHRPEAVPKGKAKAKGKEKAKGKATPKAATKPDPGEEGPDAAKGPAEEEPKKGIKRKAESELPVEGGTNYEAPISPVP